MATQICALARVHLHHGFRTSFSKVSSCLRATLSQRFIIYKRPGTRRNFHHIASVRKWNKSIVEKQKFHNSQDNHRSHFWREGSFDRSAVIGRRDRRATCWLSEERNTCTLLVATAWATAFVGVFIERGRSPNCSRLRPSRVSWKVRAISNRYRAITAAKNQRRNTVSVVHSPRPINLGQRAINRARGTRNTEPAWYLTDPRSPTYEPMLSFLCAPCCIW